jgi:uncharacterized peroxidase-related enzyme
VIAVPHIALAPGVPGIFSLLSFRPETAAPLTELVNVLLRGPNSLTPAERELIATYVSSQNACVFCRDGHGAIAAAYLDDEALVSQVTREPEAAPISTKLKALLALAGRVQQGGLAVRHDDIMRARQAGANDTEIHDTVLIAAAFCMYNRYVDGLAAWTPDDPDGYRQRARLVAERGYGRPPSPAAPADRG